MKIGELAQITGCTVATIRFYESEGLIPVPNRTSSNYRSYGPLHVDRLRFIRNCRILNMTHNEIHTLLKTIDHRTNLCGNINAVVDAHIGHVDKRIQELQTLKDQLISLREACPNERLVQDCGIMQELATMIPTKTTAPLSHVG